MKKIILIMVSVLLFGVAKAEDKPLDPNKLPSGAKTFIAKHFGQLKVSSAAIDKEIMGTEYTAHLENGTKLEFNKSGALKEIDGGKNSIPASVIPKKILDYVSKNFAGNNVVKLNVDSTDYEVELSNKTELKFDLKGNFLRMDD